MNNIQKALRYIYIYILTLWTAGWAHDREPRGVWEERCEDRGSDVYIPWQKLFSLGWRRWNGSNKNFVYNGELYHLHHCAWADCFKEFALNSFRKRDRGSNFPRTGLSSQRLTSAKEVAV